MNDADDKPGKVPQRAPIPASKSWTTGESLMFFGIVALSGLFIVVLIVGLCFLLLAS